MKQFTVFLLTLAGVLTIISCSTKQGKLKAEPAELEEVPGIENAAQEKQTLVFQETLSLQNITFDIAAVGEGSACELTIQPEGLEIVNRKVSHKIDGQVVDAEIEDLNSDGFPELLVYTTSAGSGSYGNVIGYSVNNGKSMSQIYFPEISGNKDLSIGYMGHDEFAIVENSLVQRFPVYKPNDSNSKATGGTRQIQYKLKDGEACRIFVIDKISEY